MRAITRYVMWELLKVFGFSLICLTLLLVLVGVLQEAVRMNLSLGPTLRLLPYVLPNALAFAVRRGFPCMKDAPYMTAQVIGAFAGAALVYAVYHDAINLLENFFPCRRSDWRSHRLRSEGKSARHVDLGHGRLGNSSAP